ncbi:DUF2339 domain-containing protein [Sphingomonas sp. AX6]|uniref:DUF2339 domain-containing protein n=1 Tax=Sphingomonas sp. AX6 TaxID=2653171 RepID=UPI0012F1BFC8|nr:DUF2339 domain-containing protein [Sphingomonas sp. AX6]VXC57479.1 conserved membrane hypothetical protein [Sphingomonas sp. AX6]
MTGLLLLAVLILAGVAVHLHRRLSAVERRANDLEAMVDLLGRWQPVEDLPSTATKSRIAPWRFPASRATQAAPVAPPTDAEIPTPPARPPLDLESMIAGRLPIWIGGAALVLAGFFLVRWSIESGLLGPGVRVVLAALFAVALITASEAARRIPATADDPRIGQVLAGAGIASAYGTLYMAAALYDLITPLPAFVLMIGVTAAGLVLALRHGPPTAVMALVGGFAAPLIAGFDVAGIGPLLVYLGLFVAALFGLAIHRGWAWLALAATASGFAWINLLLFLLGPGDLPAVGLFVVLLSIGATLALPATEMRVGWVRLLPLAGGLVQLLLLAPALDFSGLAWGFYITLSAAALILAWRDPRLVIAAVGAALLVLILLATTLFQPQPGAAPWMTVAATLLFGGTGHALTMRDRNWSLVAVAGTAGPWIIALGTIAPRLADTLWMVSGLALAAACASLAWRRRALIDSRDPGLILGSAFAAILFVLALDRLVPFAWIALPIVVAMAALAWWADRTPDRDLARFPTLAFAAAILAAAQPLLAWVNAALEAVTGNALIYAALPGPLTAMLSFAVPALAAVGLLKWKAKSFAAHRPQVALIATGLALVALHILAKQVFAIATPQAFAANGFLERAVITQALLAAAWWLRRTDRQPMLAALLTGLALFRILWFDLIVFNAAFVAQSVGPLPVLNLAVAHATLAAFWLWTMPPHRSLRASAAAMTLVAGLALVRQLAQGDSLTGGIVVMENWGYSAVPLGIGLFWLWRGIATDKRDLRTLGIALLTAVTFKVFLLDAARLDGFLRVLSFLGLGLALIGIGALYGRFLRRPKTTPNA